MFGLHKTKLQSFSKLTPLGGSKVSTQFCFLNFSPNAQHVRTWVGTVLDQTCCSDRFYVLLMLVQPSRDVYIEFCWVSRLRRNPVRCSESFEDFR